ncbi:MAG: polysaccharide biosynthesis/export family protein [Sphingomonadaceae bacterium]
MIATFASAGLVRRATLLGAAAMALAAAASAQAQAPAQPAAASQRPAQQPGYVLGPGDAISVNVYGHESFNVATRIKPDGTIAMPLIGNVTATGHTVVSLAKEISEQLTRKNFLRDPIVNVEIGDYRSQTVRVVGQVGRPGIVPLDQPQTLLDVLLRAGWVRTQGARTIYVRRGGDAEEQAIDIDLLLRGDPAADIPMEPGLTIYVPDPELVYIMGPVMRPGGYPLMEGMTIGRLITMAGGAAPGGSVKRFRLERGGQQVKDATAETVLRPGDVITMRGGMF